MNASTDFAAGRYEFLDWLRVLAIFILLFFHTGMLFVGWGWHIQNSQSLPALVLPMGIAHRLRMPLLFVIAGAAVSKSCANAVFDCCCRWWWACS